LPPQQKYCFIVFEAASFSAENALSLAAFAAPKCLKNYKAILSGYERKDSDGKGVGETVVSPWRKVLETERFPGSERSERRLILAPHPKRTRN
jgi:hypothetical protein